MKTEETQNNNNLRAVGHDLINKASKAVHDGMETVKEKGQEAYETATQKVIPAAQKNIEKLEDSAAQLLKKGSSMIRKYPLQSILVGLGVGCLVGTFFRSRSQSK